MTSRSWPRSLFARTLADNGASSLRQARAHHQQRKGDPMRTRRPFGVAVLWAAALALLLGGSGQAKAELIVNGGFENHLTGWSASTGSASISSLVPHTGNCDAGLHSSSPWGDPSWSQTVTGLTVGDTYTLSFWYLNSINNVGNELWASFGGTRVFDVIDPHTGYLTSANYWEATVTVTATSTTETLVFGGYTNLGYFRLDDVSLVPAAPAAPPYPSLPP